ncbi:MAG: hypothetical protein ABIK86_02025 [candidate division WOR-3 bacterium]
MSAGGTNVLCDTVRAKVYCVNEYQDNVRVFDARADTLIKTIPLGRCPAGVCWNRANSRVYITDGMDNVVYVIRDTTTGIAEASPAALGRTRRSAVTVVRRALFWTERAPGTLMDLTGRRVLAVTPGRNDLTHLAPGVYLALAPGSREMRRVTKVE